MSPTKVRTAADFIPTGASLTELCDATQHCRGCELYKHATQVVFGEGSSRARMVLVGEQPGDKEDQQGHPSVGPAGKLLARVLDDAGIDRAAVYVTNAVKHFKFEERGKRRLHKKPAGSEILACRPWLEAEIKLVRPKVIVCLGATAAGSILGKTHRLTRERGRLVEHRWAPFVTSTVHPSAVLRAQDDSQRQLEYQRFVADLKKAAEAL